MQWRRKRARVSAFGYGVLIVDTISLVEVTKYRSEKTSSVPEPRNMHKNDLDRMINELNLKSVQSDGISFLAPLALYQSEKPYLSRLPSGTSLARANLVTSNHKLDIFDLSGHEKHFTLADSGFEFARSPIRILDSSDSSVCSKYIPQMELWLREHLHCTNVLIYAYNVGVHPVLILDFGAINACGPVLILIVPRKQLHRDDRQNHQDTFLPRTLW